MFQGTADGWPSDALVERTGAENGPRADRLTVKRLDGCGAAALLFELCCGWR